MVMVNEKQGWFHQAIFAETTSKGQEGQVRIEAVGQQLLWQAKWEELHSCILNYIYV